MRWNCVDPIQPRRVVFFFGSPCFALELFVVERRGQPSLAGNNPPFHVCQITEQGLPDYIYIYTLRIQESFEKVFGVGLEGPSTF